MQTFSYLFLKFMYYSFIGYIMEVLFTLLLRKKFVNRGFLIGPYCSIYGVAGLVLSLFNPKMNIIWLFLLSMMGCFVIEGLTGFLLDKIFKMRWWDYRKEFLNLNGYVCLKFMLLFGLFSLIGIYLLNPLYDYLYYLIGNVKYYISVFLLVIYIMDTVFSIILTNMLKKVITPSKRSDTSLIISAKRKMLFSLLR